MPLGRGLNLAGSEVAMPAYIRARPTARRGGRPRYRTAAAPIYEMACSQDIQVQRLTRGYQVRVSYALPLDFRVYPTDVRTTFEARSALLAWD